MILKYLTFYKHRHAFVRICCIVFLIIKTGYGALVVLSNVSAGKTQILLSVNSALREGCFGIC